MFRYTLSYPYLPLDDLSLYSLSNPYLLLDDMFWYTLSYPYPTDYSFNTLHFNVNNMNDLSRLSTIYQRRMAIGKIGRFPGGPVHFEMYFGPWCGGIS